MKKYISLMAIAIVAIFASCSNDDVTISKSVNFTVNPYTVVSPYIQKFSYILTDILKSNKGELESFSTNYSLRVRTFVYDENGILVTTMEGKYSNYDVKLKESKYLPQGKYTAIAISDIYRSSDGFEFWKVSGEDQLATLKIADSGYILDALKQLGLSKQTFIVGEESVDVNIDIQPVGAMILVLYTGVHEYSDVTSYELSCNKSVSSLVFNSSGEYTVNSENNNGSFDWRVSSIDVDDVTSWGYREWAVVLPMNNFGVCFSYLLEGKTKPEQFKISKTWDCKVGDAYFCWLDLDSEYGNSVDYVTAEEAEAWFKNTSDSRRSAVAKAKSFPLLDETKVIKRNDATVGQYIYPKNLK